MPRAKRRDLAGRPGVNLEVQAGLTPTVRKRRDTLYADFVSWVEGELDCVFARISCSGLLLATALIGYGKFLFYSGSPRYLCSETLNSVCARFQHHKSTLAGAWAVLTRWQEEEPSSRGMVLPEVLFRAAVSICFLEPFVGLADLYGRASSGLPWSAHAGGDSGSETLRHRDLILPSDLLSAVPLAYVRIVALKDKSPDSETACETFGFSFGSVS